MYRVMHPAVLRAGPDLTSKRTERLRVGERLRILESRDDSAGRTRVRCSRGWLSLTSKRGDPLILPVGEEEAQGLHVAYQLLDTTDLLEQCDPWSSQMVRSIVG